MSSLTKFFPVPVHPCRESTKGFFGFLLLRNPLTAFRMMREAMCCPKSLFSRSTSRPVKSVHHDYNTMSPEYYLELILWQLFWWTTHINEETLSLRSYAVHAINIKYIHSKTSARVKNVHNHLLHYTWSILNCNFHVNNSILSVLVWHLNPRPMLLWSDPQRLLKHWLSKKRKAMHKYL